MVAALVGQEVSEHFGEFSVDLRKALRDALDYVSPISSQDVDKWMDHGWFKRRQHDQPSTIPGEAHERIRSGRVLVLLADTGAAAVGVWTVAVATCLAIRGSSE
jgi:hypothetical protein